MPVFIAFLGSLAVIVIVVAIYVVIKRMHLWLPGYMRDATKRQFSGNLRNNGTVDIMLILVDHFELAGKPERLDAWMDRYPALARMHGDSDGCRPKHSWFYALDLMHEHEVEAIGSLVDADLGEIELHWHHGHDTEKSFREKLRQGMDIFHKHGHMLPFRAGQKACFAFIHGNWSLDNSRGSEFCGVDNEIEVLIDEGCYADFTYPALFNEGQPAISNQIYYARDDGKPKAYNNGRRATVGRVAETDELMLVQGPLLINWRDWRFRWHPAIEDGDINFTASHGDARRIDSWIRRDIHVTGQPNWRFVKLFCHGAQDNAAVLGKATDRMYSYLESNYNDGKQYRLHYVSAREAYNIIRAAEDGKQGNPGEFRDYAIPPPGERRKLMLASASQCGKS